MSSRTSLFLRPLSANPFRPLYLTFLGIIFSLSLYSQTTIAIQDFDGATPDWSYSSDVPFFDNGNDGFFGIQSPFTPLEYANLQDSVLFENDLDDEGDNGTSGFANVTFDPVDVSAFTGVVVTFDFDIEGYNANNDEAHYEIFLDGVGQGQVTLQDGMDPGDDAEGTVTENIPDGTNTVGVVISIRNNGASGYSGFDNFKVEGVASGGAPQVSFSVASADVNEDAGTYDICLTIVNPDISISTSATVSLTPDGSATNGTDINMYTDQMVTFPAGDNTPQCVTITIIDDTEIDEDETLVFEISSVTGGMAGSQDTTTITIIDNDKLTCAEPAWNVVSPLDNEVWSPITGGFNANGFCGGGCMQDVETWLIYGPLDMTGVSLLELELSGSEGFGITDLNVQYSNADGANACPNEVAWTSVGMITASGDFAFDFSGATGTEVYIGIEYSDDGANGYSSWDLTDFALFADVCPSVGTFVTPEVSAGPDIVQCGIADVQLDAIGDGSWSGGAGSFNDANATNAIYTPDPSEEGSTVVLTYTLNLASCTGFSDDISIAFFEEPGDTEFSYGAIDICPGDGILSVMHTTGEDGTYTVTMGDETMIDLDPMNGDINLMNTSDGTYEITNTITGGGNLIISGVIDATLTGGQPKAIEFYALDDIPDLSIYGVGSANNGNGGGVIEFTFPADEVSAGSYIYVTASNTSFNTWFGFNADYVDDVANINGDDAIEVYSNGSIIDVFGDVNMDGSGEPWEYLDGWAYRFNNLGLNIGNFIVSDFIYSGINALDGESSNGTAATPFPIGTFTTDQMGICPNSVTSVTITIGDSEGPEVDCPNDIGVQLEPGECEELVFFDIPFMDNCGTIDAEASQAINEGLVNTALDCANNTSNHLRYFENNLPVPVEITQVNFGIFNSGTAETVTVNVYSIPPAAAFEYGNMTLQGTVDYAVPAGMNNVILAAMLEATIPAGMNYVLELKANNTTNFVIGYNDLGETGSTYIAGNNPVPCVSLEPVDIDVLGFGAFAVILFSNAEGGPSIEQTQGLPSGSYFPMGTTTNTFIVTDVNGNTTECTFDVNLVEFSNGVTGALTCNDNVNISLDQDCEVILGADMLLEGDQYGCYDDYEISVSGGVTGNVITQPGTYTVTITDPDTGNSCWSTINVEDKSAPTIEECACPVGGSEVMTPFVGTLDGTDPIWTRPFVAGGACNPSGAGVDIPYDTYNFSLDMDAGLGAEVVSFSAPSGDSFLCLYEESFDPTDPCGNLVITNDDGGVGLLSQFDVMLNSGVNYILVVTTFNNNGNDFGDYVVEITSDATLLELAEECNFRCVDIEYIMGSDDLTPNPSITSCSDYEAFFTDELTVDANGNQIILRTWLAQNANGSSTCTQQFNIAPIAIDELTLPISPVILSCNDGTSPEEIVAIFDNPLTQDNPNTSYVENNEGYVYAYPTYLINGHAQKVDNQVCDVYAAYTDQELDACEEGCNGNKKVIRTWTLVDWNTLEISTYIQTIKAVDTEAPTLITKDVTVSTDAWGCEASFPAPLPWELHDNCDSYPEYTITGPAGVTIEGNFEEGYVISGTPKGTHTFNYIAYDCCGNEASYPFTVTVIDSTPPVVVAKQNVVISVTSGSTNGAGLAKLYAESIDNGSYDGCSNEVKLEVRRDEDNCDIRGNATYNADGHPQDGSPNPNSPSYDPDGGEYVKFCCEDLTNATVDVNGDGELDAGYVKVWLRVWDDGDMDGIYGTAGDNYNEAWAYVKVEDKLAPAITCPPDVTLTCDMDYTDLNMTGSASAYGSCGGVDVEYNDIIINLNTCNEGFVRRRWSVVGRSDIFCDQTITMDELDAPVNVSFSQVGDFTAANCPDMIALGEPTWIAGPCDVLGYTMETDTFFFEDGACYKLVNHYTVINWCDYEPNNPFWDGEGLWEHVQVIKVTDETKPVIEDCDDKMYAINDHSDSDDDGEVCEAKITLENVATDEGSANCPTGWLKWQVLVDLWGDGTVDLEYSSFLPPFDTQFNDTNGNGIPDVYLSPTANGETVSVPLPDIVGSMSNHKVSWKVTDGCNNVTTCDTEFMVVDKKAPTPYCVDLSTAVMESSGTVELWAIDFNVGSFDNCTAQEDLRYTFSDVAPEDDPNYDDTQSSSSMTFDCSDVDNSPVEVNMYVWDEKGNADFCVVYLTLVDNTGACGQKPDIAGTVATETGVGVEEVEVTLEASLPEYPRLEMTDENGEYVFVENALNATYQLSGSKDVDYLNGVSTLDLVKIQRHILGLEELNSPYKLVAADINGDTEIKAHDLVELRKLILGIITDLPTNESWRFVNSEQELTMDMDLADVDYSQEVENLQTNTMSKDFVAVKIGDVTEDAQANLTGNTSTAVRSNKTLSLNILNQEVEAGQTVSVGFTSEEFAEVFGYQFTMELNGLEFAGIESGVVAMSEGNVGVLSSNVVTMSYNSSTAVSAGKDETIFTVKFVAKTSGNLSNMIDISSKVTNSEAYVSTTLNTSIGETLEIRNVVIEMRGDVVEVETSELYQNEPNPFKTQTTIGYRLAAEGKVNFTVHDVTGKVLINKSLSGVRGYNEITLKSSDLALSGVLYYTLESGEFTATKKMIILE